MRSVAGRGAFSTSQGQTLADSKNLEAQAHHSPSQMRTPGPQKNLCGILRGERQTQGCEPVFMRPTRGAGPPAGFLLGTDWNFLSPPQLPFIFSSCPWEGGVLGKAKKKTLHQLSKASEP